ncbi:Na+/H+ antiporter subunit E [Tissierella sp. Yu-01]|uniref:Na+/H+ antiporter subunit E n=1 Tax=Tissierella sp. Yu-01 TaxID=3035694 RepID=UPI00240E04A2|nr:Na+/H+ antiporter subunit E [Tissierella sp. Yu-01]WFA08468.1 Na+/H+ antiporter subunit E [Tissierella sp. Yu-01]
MLYILLFLFWIMLNGSITIEIVLFGLVICLFVYIFTYKNTRLTSNMEKNILRKLCGILKYLIILIVEVYKSNITIIKLVLSPTPEIKPTLKFIKVDLNSRIARVALANSITLTPGTITVSMNENDYLIHALHKDYLDGIEESIFVEKLKELEE